MSEIMGGAMCGGRIVSGACLGGKRIGLAHAGQLICPSGRNLLVYPLGVRTDGLMRCDLMPDGGLHSLFKAGLPSWNGLGLRLAIADVGFAPGDTVTLSSSRGDVFHISHFMVSCIGSNRKLYETSVWSAGAKVTFTIPTATDHVDFVVCRSVATTEDCEMTVHPMLEKGSAATVWEPPENAGGGARV